MKQTDREEIRALVRDPLGEELPETGVIEEMVNFIKRLFKLSKPSHIRISIEEQLINLAKVGITLKENIDIRDLLNSEIREYEEHPYIHLLMSMGRELDSVESSMDLYPTNDVWCFDRECIPTTRS